MISIEPTQIKKLNDALQGIKKISIISHHNPDGDAIGSALAMFHLLKSNFEVDIIMPSSFPAFLAWMEGADLIIDASKKKDTACKSLTEADLVVCVDFNAKNRVEALTQCLSDANGLKVLIDHHPYPVIEDFDIHFSDVSVSSTAELIFHLMKAMKWDDKANEHFANACLVGIMTDTGSFSFACDDERTFLVAAELIKLGAVVSEVNRKIYGQVPFNRLKLLGFSLNEKLNLVEQNHEIAYISLSTKEMNRHKYQTGDTEGLVNWALSIKDVKMAALITEQKGNIKFSFRSVGDISVNQLAKDFFNGGGHQNAAGGKFTGTLEEAVQYFIKHSVDFMKS